MYICMYVDKKNFHAVMLSFIYIYVCIYFEQLPGTFLLSNSQIWLPIHL